MMARLKRRDNKISTISHPYPQHINVVERGMVSSQSQNGGVSLASSENDDYCIIGRYFAYILMLTSIFGMAPLRFESHKKGYKISVSKPMQIYSYVLAFLVGSAATFGKVVEMSLCFDTTQEKRAKLEQFILIYFHFTITMATISGVMTGPTRLKNLITHLIKIAKVDICLGAQYSRVKDIKFLATAVFIFILVNLLFVYDFYLTRDDGWCPIVSLGVLCLEIDMMTTMYIQFVYIFVFVRTRFQSINDALTIVTSQWSDEFKSHIPESVNICTIQEDDTVTDGVIIVRKFVTEYPRLVVSPNVAIQRIAILRGSLCDIINSINRDCGLTIIITMLSAIGNIAVGLFYQVIAISKLQLREKVFFDIIYLVSSSLWLLLYIAVMIFLIEPCHETVQEDKKTRRIICQMMRSAPSSGMLLSLLEMFGYQVMLKPASYEPLGMCTLNRPLMVSIVGAVSTYLVILLQY